MNTNINTNFISMFSKKEDDVNSMEKKMNKILKRKKYKENYKNILELNNIYETNDLSNTEDKEPKIEEFAGRKKNKKNTAKKFTTTAATATSAATATTAATAINSIGSRDKGPGKTVIEKNKGEENFDSQINNFKDQLDKLSSRIRKLLSSISEKILYLITAAPNRLDNLLHSFLLKFVMIMNNTKKEEQNNPKTYEDVNVLKSIIYSFVAFPISMFVCYNWLYMTFYKNDLVNQLRPNISFDKLGVFKSLFDFFFFYAIKPLYYFDKITLEPMFLPTVLKLFPYRILVKLLLLVVSYCLILYSVSIFTNAYNGKFNIISFFCSIIIAIHFGIFLKDFLIETLPNSFIKMIPLNLFTIVISIIIIICIILYILLKGMIAYLSIHLSVMIVFLYFFILSFFGISMYGGDILGNIKKIDDFIKEDIKNLFKDETCEYTSIFEKILIFVCKFLYGNLFSAVYFVILFVSFFVINNKIHSMNVKMIVNILVFLQVVFLLGNMFHKYGAINKEENIVVAAENVDEYSEKYGKGPAETGNGVLSPPEEISEEIKNVTEPVAETINNSISPIHPETSILKPGFITDLNGKINGEFNEKINEKTENMKNLATSTAENLAQKVYDKSTGLLGSVSGKASSALNGLLGNATEK